MIYLLFTMIFFEMAMIILFVFKTPLRKLVILGLDRLKRGRGPVVVKTVVVTVLVVFMSSVYSMMEIQKRGIDEGAVTPTDQVLMAKRLLEATLMGSILFLALMIDRLHHYMRELRLRRMSMEAVKKESRSLEDARVMEIKTLKEKMATVQAKLKQLEIELEERRKEANTFQADAIALKKQSEGFLVEYGRLLEENQNLRNQLKIVDMKLSRSVSKKNS